MPEVMGSGAALLDYDNDGALDVFLVQGTPAYLQALSPLVPPPPGWKPGNRLFHNNSTLRTGQTHARSPTLPKRLGLGHADQGMGVAAGDYDNDGYTDLYVTNYGHNILYHNNGNRCEAVQDGCFGLFQIRKALGSLKRSQVRFVQAVMLSVGDG